MTDFNQNLSKVKVSKNLQPGVKRVVMERELLKDSDVQQCKTQRIYRG